MFAALLPACPVIAGVLDLKNAVVLAPAALSRPEKKAVAMLIEEVERRTQVRWATVSTPPPNSRAVIAVGQAASLRPLLGARMDRLPASGGKEGYRIATAGSAVFAVGNDERGTLFAIGRLLRLLRMDRQQVALDDSVRIASSPHYAIRGHQIGYRPKVNSYDAWTPAVFEQYVRDMAVFGVNAVELIPPHSDDDEDSPHFPLTKIDMMAEMSRILAEYGLDVWIWYPALPGQDHDDPKRFAIPLKSGQKSTPASAHRRRLRAGRRSGRDAAEAAYGAAGKAGAGVHNAIPKRRCGCRRRASIRVDGRVRSAS